MDSSGAFGSFRIFFIECFTVKVIEMTVYLCEQMRKRMNRFFGQIGTLVHSVPSKRVDEQCAGHVFFKDSMPFA